MVHLLFFALQAFASDPIFTTVFYDGEGVVHVGLKNDSESRIASFTYPDGAPNHVSLPEEIRARTVIGVIPDREKLFVLSQSADHNDKTTRLDLYNQAAKNWKKIGAVDCIAFTKVRISVDRLVFACEWKMHRGRLRVRNKELRLGKERLYRTGIMRFPEFLLRYKSLAFILEGSAPSWDKLRIKNEGEADRVIPAGELFGAP